MSGLSPGTLVPAAGVPVGAASLPAGYRPDVALSGFGAGTIAAALVLVAVAVGLVVILATLGNGGEG